MNPVEDLLTRTLRDPARELPVPADPVPAIRRRARAQRRNSVLGAAAVVLVVAATLLAPAAVGRLTGPAPVATEPAPAGLLEWPASGPLAGDASLVRDAIDRWRDPAGPVRLLWAGRVDAARVVVLQATGADGTPALAEVADRAGELTLLRVEPIGDPGSSALRLVDPVRGSARTLLLPRPGAASVTVLTDPPRSADVPAGGVVTLAGDLRGRSMAVLDRDVRILGDGQVPDSLRMLVLPGRIRLVSPVWDSGTGRRPEPADYAEAAVLTERLGTPAAGPTEVGVILDGPTVPLRSGREAELHLYELHRAGRSYRGWIVRVGGAPRCTHLDDVTAAGSQPDAIVLRCPLPADRTGIVALLPHNGIQITGLSITAARPGETAMEKGFSPPARGLYVIEPRAGFPTGPGSVRLEDVAGSPRPPLSLPPYTP